jgi:hypothetical protein
LRSQEEEEEEEEEEESHLIILKSSGGLGMPLRGRRPQQPAGALHQLVLVLGARRPSHASTRATRMPPPACSFAFWLSRLASARCIERQGSCLLVKLDSQVVLRLWYTMAPLVHGVKSTGESWEDDARMEGEGEEEEDDKRRSSSDGGASSESSG